MDGAWASQPSGCCSEVVLGDGAHADGAWASQASGCCSEVVLAEGAWASQASGHCSEVVLHSWGCRVNGFHWLGDFTTLQFPVL